MIWWASISLITDTEGLLYFECIKEQTRRRKEGRGSDGAGGVYSVRRARTRVCSWRGCPRALPLRMWVWGGVWAAQPAGIQGRTEWVGLTDAAGLRDFVEGPEQVAPQLLDIDEVIEHGVGQVHQIVQVDGVALGTPEGHVERSRLTCRRDGRVRVKSVWLTLV